MSLGPMDLPPELWQHILDGTPPPDATGPPAPPTFTPPELLTAPGPDFRSRLGTALAGVQSAPGGQPYESGGSAFARGLLSGGARGFSAVQGKKDARAAAGITATNTARKSEADRNYQNERDTWRAKLTAFYRTQSDRDGKVKVTKQMASDMNLPEAFGSFMDPAKVGDRIALQRNAATVPPELAPTLGMQPGGKTSPGVILGARNILKPKEAKAPPKVSPSETRRGYVVGIVADLRRRGLADRYAVQDYLGQPGVVDALAKHGILPNDVLSEFPQ